MVEYHPFSAIRDCLFSALVFATIAHMNEALEQFMIWRVIVSSTPGALEALWSQAV